jgi:hypothetical protein
MTPWMRLSAALLVSLGWSWLVGWLAAVMFEGSWMGYGVALGIALPSGAALGWWAARIQPVRAPGRWRLG